ncbi:MAG TPA: aldehyde dehydrogenase family protein [Xanthobacteraceae bacterium]|nr:aldehyde dehydrogenase family protein [Xanthobacteraceae bacterium]
MNIQPDLHTGGQQITGFLQKAHCHLIDGEWIEPASGKRFDVFNPATGQVIARVAEGNAGDVDRAVRAARKAFDDGPWSRMSPSERSRLLLRLADALEDATDEFALLDTLDNGMPITMARGINVAGSVDRLRYYAGWATKLSGETLAMAGQNPQMFHSFTLREPVGVAGLIVPWNMPLLMVASKVAPALAAGCTVILKPAEQTPLSALRFGELVQDVGIPAGVVNIVTGFGETGAALVDHPGVDKISFTGSAEVGKQIVRASTSNLKRVTLELGGKSPVVVFPDADVSTAIAGASRSIFSNTGQVCAAGSRLFVHERLFDQVVDGVADTASRMKIGPGIDPATEMGPVISQDQLDRINGYVRAGRDAGATVIASEAGSAGPGYFVQPTVLTGTTPEMSVRREEIFGPVLCAMSFSDDDLDAIAREANDTDFGLSALIFTRDLSVAHKMAKKIRAGTVRINGGGLDPNIPFGGFKQSGWGRESGREGIEAFTEIKSVTIGL